MIVWNRKENRPASYEEVKEMHESGEMYVNYYVFAKTKPSAGEVWVDLSNNAENTYELREK